MDTTVQQDTSQTEEKFLFHIHNFSEGFVPEEEEPPPPVYSQQDLDKAKKDAHAAGREEALAEAKASRGQKVSETLETIANQTAKLFDQENVREKRYEQEAVALALAAFKKLFPLYMEKFGSDELEAQISAILQEQSGQQAITFHVSTENTEAITAFAQKLKDSNNTLNLKVVTDETLSDKAARLSWSDGGALRDPSIIAQQITDRMQEMLAGTTANSHDKNEDAIIKQDDPPKSDTSVEE